MKEDKCQERSLLLLLASEKIILLFKSGSVWIVFTVCYKERVDREEEVRDPGVRI